MIAVPVGASDVSGATPTGEIIESGPDAYKTAAPKDDDIKAGKASMHRGMSGPEVMELQKKLNAMGAKPPLAVDGKFGPLTEGALKAAQGSNGIQATGVYGAASLAKLANNPKPISEEQMTANSTAATTNIAGLKGSALGSKIGDAAEKSANQLNSVGKCALGVNNALESLGIPGRGNAYEKAEQLAKNSKFKEVNVATSDLKNLPRGAVVVWGRSSAKPWGHVSVALGGGREASDHIQNQVGGGRYGTDFGRGADPQGRQARVFIPN
jgi:peptidoglycan hydrolase-like protein with peptidoglycan-binding domain